MKYLFHLFLLSFLLGSCTDDTEKAATEYCDCFGSKMKKVSSGTSKLMTKVANSKDPQQTLQTEIAEMDEEDQLTVREELERISNVANESNIKDCEERIAAYKIRGKDEKARMQKVLERMKQEKGCEALTALMVLGLQKQGDEIADENTVEEAEEEVTPKKKKVAKENDEE